MKVTYATMAKRFRFHPQAPHRRALSAKVNTLLRHASPGAFLLLHVRQTPEGGEAFASNVAPDVWYPAGGTLPALTLPPRKRYGGLTEEVLGAWPSGSILTDGASHAFLGPLDRSEGERLTCGAHGVLWRGELTDQWLTVYAAPMGQGSPPRGEKVGRCQVLPV